MIEYFLLKKAASLFEILLRSISFRISNKNSFGEND